jgi:glycosyltransferase involved in cell wall biosynthesis
MKSPILFSIIIPVRQSNPFLAETLKALKKQKTKRFEHFSHYR